MSSASVDGTASVAGKENAPPQHAVVGACSARAALNNAYEVLNDGVDAMHTKSSPHDEVYRVVSSDELDEGVVLSSQTGKATTLKAFPTSPSTKLLNIGLENLHLRRSIKEIGGATVMELREYNDVLERELEALRNENKSISSDLHSLRSELSKERAARTSKEDELSKIKIVLSNVKIALSNMREEGKVGRGEREARMLEKVKRLRDRLKSF